MRENNVIANVTNALNEVKNSVANAFADLKNHIVDRLAVLASVKADLRDAFDEVDALSEVISDFACDMDGIAEEAYESAEDLYGVLEVIDPDFVKEIEDLDDEDEEENYDDYDDEEDYEVLDDEQEYEDEEVEIVEVDEN